MTVNVGEQLQDPTGSRPYVSGIHDDGLSIYITYPNGHTKKITPEQAEAWRLPSEDSERAALQEMAKRHGFTWKDELP